LTAQTLLEAMALPVGASVAVTGAAGAVGGYAVELAKQAGLTVIADAAPADVEAVRRFGADHVLARGAQFVDQVRQVAPDGVDGVIDSALVGATAESIVRAGGVVGSPRPHIGPTSREVHWRYVYVGDHLHRTDLLEEIRDLAATGALTLRVAESFDPEHASRAHELIETAVFAADPSLSSDRH
jgi:NADPH:quinone reductase-like Zn-dependent oxidoreductase